MRSSAFLWAFLIVSSDNAVTWSSSESSVWPRYRRDEATFKSLAPLRGGERVVRGKRLKWAIAGGERVQQLWLMQESAALPLMQGLLHLLAYLVMRKPAKRRPRYGRLLFANICRAKGRILLGEVRMPAFSLSDWQKSQKNLEKCFQGSLSEKM